MATKTFDAGDRLMIDGDSQAEVESALQAQVARGSKVVTAPVAVGRRWLAACTIATQGEEATSSLTLSADHQVQKGQRDGPEVDDGCTVVEMGFKRLIRGPSERHVKLRIEHLKRFGANLVGEIELDGDSWVAVVDTGGVDKTFRW